MSAKRFGGKYSPDADHTATPTENQFRNRKVARPNTAAKLLYIPAFVMLIAALRETGSNASAMLLELSSGSGGLVTSLIFGAVAAGAHVIGFGLDPMRKKGLEGVSEFETDRVARAVDKAEDLVRATLDASKRIGDRGLESRVERLANSARAVFRTVEDDPRDLPRARKFMSVYLMGARDATAKFADLYSRERDPEARHKYEALLSDLEASFEEHRETLLIDNRTDLDVEIEVLRERLQTEGLKAD